MELRGDDVEAVAGAARARSARRCAPRRGSSVAEKQTTSNARSRRRRGCARASSFEPRETTQQRRVPLLHQPVADGQPRLRALEHDDGVGVRRGVVVVDDEEQRSPRRARRRRGSRHAEQDAHGRPQRASERRGVIVVAVAALRRYVVAHQGYASRFRRARTRRRGGRDPAAAGGAARLDRDRRPRAPAHARRRASAPTPEPDALAPAARGPQLRVLGARGVPAADRGLPALQAADARAEGSPLVGPPAHRRGPRRSSAHVLARIRERGRAAGARVRGPERADVGLEAREARARASVRGGRARDRRAPGLPARCTTCPSA